MMRKSAIFVGICGFFVSYASLACAECGLTGCSGSTYVRAAQVCSLDDHFNKAANSFVCLGEAEKNPHSENYHPLYAGYVRAEQVCSLDDHFNEPGKSLMCLGDAAKKPPSRHSRSLYADVEPGIYSSGIDLRFETFDDYEMECTARGFCETSR